MMEEWRLGKDSRGRTSEAQWKLIMQGCKVSPGSKSKRDAWIPSALQIPAH